MKQEIVYLLKRNFFIKKKGILFQLKNSWHKNKSSLLFLLKLLILLGFLKLIFFFYNKKISNGWELEGISNMAQIIEWGLFYDILCICTINILFFLILIIASRLSEKKYFQNILPLPFAILNTLMLVLNCIDIFYFRFQLQRSSTDLLYVFRQPLQYGNSNTWWAALGSFILIIICLTWIFKRMRTLVQMQAAEKKTTILGTVFILLLFLITTVTTGTKKLLPNYPLSKLPAIQLPLTQNSLLNFVYSTYRINETSIPTIYYMDEQTLANTFSIRQKNDRTSSPKNIVLFIMESVPLEFFSDSSAYKPRLPFLDSLIKKSRFFNNAFSYSYSSNKGITAILGGIPTLTDLPLYHSGFTSISKTAPGLALAQNNYSSAFFIGDNYDDFGFAKCARWMGFGKYYSMEDIPNYKSLEQHTMGLHDEYVLNFMQQKLTTLPEPFLAVQYNISTHYPNDIPAHFKKNNMASNITPPMLSMQYYDACLKTFFENASQQPWFKNSVFIFCSDHWAQPHEKVINIDKVDALRIPIFIYEPLLAIPEIIHTPVSQLDILNTILYYGGYSKSFISYGKNIEKPDSNRVVFAKLNGSVYQAIDKDHVLGFNAAEGKALYLYNYISDPRKQQNILSDTILPKNKMMLQKMKAFLQTATAHYRQKAKP